MSPDRNPSRMTPSERAGAITDEFSSMAQSARGIREILDSDPSLADKKPDAMVKLTPAMLDPIALDACSSAWYEIHKALLDEERQAKDAPEQIAQAIVEPYGFTLHNTGGGCMALSRLDDSGANALITDAMCCDVPTPDSFLIGVYAPDESSAAVEFKSDAGLSLEQATIAAVAVLTSIAQPSQTQKIED